jgi:predicted alpha/beta-fold hydrolase
MTAAFHGYRRAAGGHFWTIAPWARHVVWPAKAPPSDPWGVTVHDPKMGPVRLSGRLRALPGARSLLLVVHGLGGAVENFYAVAAARAAEAAGVSSLRLALRGADRRGEDFYHAGLTADLEAAIGSPELSSVSSIHVVGYSLGGHVVLRYAALNPDPRVRSVAAVCAPLDLDAGARAIDAPERFVYRRHILLALLEIYAEVAARRPVPIPLAEARKIRTIREWDRRTVAPRHGFRDAEHYYASVSVAPLLDRIGIPALYVFAENDPMVPSSIIRPVLFGAGQSAEVRWIERGGHIGFPDDLDLGVGAPLGLPHQIVAWLLRRGG